MTGFLLLGTVGTDLTLAADSDAEPAAEAAEELSVAQEDEAEEEQSFRLKDLAEAYSAPEGEENGYKIIYAVNATDDVTVSKYAEKRIAAAENENIKLVNDGTLTQVVQSFSKGSEDSLAPFVYLKKGYAFSKRDTWKLTYTYTESVYVEDGYWSYDNSGEGSWLPTGEGHYENQTKNVEYTFAYDATVSDVLSKLGTHIPDDGKIHLYPNWKKSAPLGFDLQGDSEYREVVDVSEVYNFNDEMEIGGYLTTDPIELEAPVGEPEGFSFVGWKYRFGEGAVQEAVLVDTKTDEEGKVVELAQEDVRWTIPTGSHKEKLTVYANWEPYHYSISYVGIKVKAEELPGADTAFEELAFGDEEVPDLTALPDYYTAVTNTVLPSAEEINKGVLDPDFSKDNVFLCWSKSRKFNKTVRSLGRGGEVKSGDVTLYVIFTSKYPTPQLEAPEEAEAKSFKAVQINTPNLLNRGEYAVVELIGADVSADADTAVLSEEAAKYFELCDVDDRWAQLAQGYATIGIRLKSDADLAAAQEAIKLKKISLKVQSELHETDEKGEPLYTEVSVKLRLKLTIPRYKLDSAKSVLYTALLGEGEDKVPGFFFIKEKNGALDPEAAGDNWVAELVTKNGKSYVAVPETDARVEVDKDNNIVVSAYKGMKGFIRLRNSGWLEGAYSYCPYVIKENAKAPALAFSQKKLTLNNGHEDEKAYGTVSYKGGMFLDPSLLSLDASALPEGITANLYEDVVTVKGAKDVKPGTYRLSVSCEGVKKPVVIKVKVEKTKAEKAVKISVKGKLDAVMGGSLYLKPTLKGFGGIITDIRVKAEEGKPAAFETEWNGSSAELYTNENFAATTDKISIPMEVVLNTGRVLPFTLTTKPSKGKVSLDVYDAVLAVPAEADPEAPVSVSVPVIATYTYTYYIDEKTKCTRVYTADLSTEEGKARMLIGEEQKGLSKEGVYSGSYKDGVITISYTGSAPEKETAYSLSLEGKWAATGKKATAGFKLNIKAKAAAAE